MKATEWGRRESEIELGREEDAGGSDGDTGEEHEHKVINTEEPKG